MEPLEERRLLAIDLAGLADWLEQGSQPITQASSVADPDNPAGGAVEDLAIDPNDPSHMFAATVNGGIWRTHDGDRPFNGVDDDGANGVDDGLEQPSWTATSDQHTSLGINGIAFDPLDATGNTVFAGTGSASSLSNTGGLPIGIMKSTDDGANWFVYQLNPAGSEPQVREVVPTTYTNADDPTVTSQVVLVGTLNGVFRSIDGGETYTNVSTSDPVLPTGAVTDLIADPNNEAVFYAGIAGSGVFRTANAGATWAAVNNATLSTNGALGTSTAVMLTAHAGAGTTQVYAMISYDDDGAGTPEIPTVFTTTDGGANWVQLAATPAGMASGNGNLYPGMACDQIIVDRTNQNIVYIAKGYGGSPHVFRYNPAGAGSWDQIESSGDVNNTRPHVDHRDFQFTNSGGNDVLINANDGGLYFLVDPQAPDEWVGLHGRGATGIGAMEYTNVTLDSNFGELFGGAQDNGTSSQTGAGTRIWQSFRGSDGGDVQATDIDDMPGGNSFRFSATQPPNAPNQNQSPISRHEFDATGELSETNLFPTTGLTGFTPTFVAQFELNVIDTDRLVIGGGTGNGGTSPLYELTNARTATGPGDAMWVAVGGITTAVNDNDDAAFVAGGRRNGVDNAEFLVVGSGTTVFLRSTAGAVAATPTAFPGGTIQAIAVDPDDWQHIFVADSNQVWETTNAGMGWTEITENLQEINSRLQSLAYVPTPEGDVILVGGNLGVSRRPVGVAGAPWTRLGANLPNALVSDLEYHADDDILSAGTFGRGAWIVEDASTVVNDAPVLNICGDEDQVNQDDVIRLVLNMANPLLLDIYLNSMAPVFTVPLAALEQVNVFGIGGNDELTVDSSFGLIDVLNGIRYDGDGACPGTQPGYGYDRGFDTLILDQADDEGDTQDSDTYSVGPAMGSGTSIIEGDSGTQTVFFEELEPVIDLVPADDLIVNATAESNVINYVSGSTIFRGLITIDNYESLEFLGKEDVTVNAGLGNDTVNLNNANTPSGLTEITVNAGDGDDAVTTQSAVSVPVVFVGGAGNDSLDASGALDSATLEGNEGNDHLDGGPADDDLSGGVGNDVLVGGAGNNTYSGGAGFDTILILGTLGNDTIDVSQTGASSITSTVNGSASTESIGTAIEQIQVDARQGNDLIRVTTADNLPATSVQRFYIQGDAPNASDRLIVTDAGTGDLVIVRQAPDQRSGRVSVAPGAPTPPPEVVYEGVERLDILPIDPVTGGTGTGGGQIKVFHSDPFEYNDNRLAAGQLARVPESATSPVIDPGGFAAPFNVPSDEDWYDFRPQATGTFSVKILFDTLLNVPSGRPGLPGAGNLDLDIYDANGALITSGVVAPGGKEAVFAATDDPLFPQFNRIFVRVHGTTANSINVYDFDDLTGLGTGNPGVENVDIFGPQVIDVTVNNLTTAQYNLFGVKPGNALQGPAPLVDSLLIHFQDLPPRAAGFLYAALDTGLTPDEARGLFEVNGDANGIIAIDNVIITNPAPGAIGEIPTATIRLVFAEPLPDDRFALTIDDSLGDPVGNRLDGESNGDEPNGAPFFPSGDGNTGGDFVARFTVDTRPEIGTYALGSTFIDINGNFVVDPHGTDRDSTNRDIAFLFGFRDDKIFAGNFAPAGAASASGFDKIGSYGQAGTGQAWRWRLDFDHDGVVDYDVASGVNTQGDPVAGNFSAAHPGDEIGLFNSGKWWLDAGGDNNIGGPGDISLQGGNIKGQPIVGDFDGDGLDDLGAWDGGNAGTQFDGIFRFDFANNGFTGNSEATIQFDIAGTFQKAIAADMNGDGIDDIGLFVSRREAISPAEAAEWYFLVSNASLAVDGTVNALDHKFTPQPFGNDLFAQFGDEAALPVVGNFDPPVSSAAMLTNDDHNPRDPMDVDNDGVVAAADVLAVINYINAGRDDQMAATSYMTAPFVDVNGDHYVAADDVLKVINYINSVPGDQSPSSSNQLAGEGEASDAYFERVSSDRDDDAADALWTLLASDGTSSPRRRR